ncbi:hypothetical protein RD110_23795 [Rhodoferax koreense]|uniref:diguanylate cyclase n=1 Tax=Rhodoferax koreensis TaxID=1842727 RepID=A0A1P8K1G5_9BURK|nr:GGDEF domain-containing protein [Rhodoferax koreense]APW39853.1 hypothetical protein RD110_23795 [Rhodoferax koreense]
MSLSRLLGCLAALLVVATLALVGRVVGTEWSSLGASNASLQAVDQLRLALVAAEMISRERGPANGALGGPADDPALRQALSAARARTDQALANLQAALPVDAGPPARRDAAARVAAAGTALASARAEVDRIVARTRDERAPQAIRDAVYGMVAVVPRLSAVTSLAAAEAQQAYPALGDTVQLARLCSELRENTGLLGSHFTAALARQQPFSPLERRLIEQTRGRIDELRFLMGIRLGASGQPQAVQHAWQTVELRYFQNMTQLLERVIAAGEGDGRYGLDPAGFAALYVPEMNTILGLRDVLLAQAREDAQTEHRRAMRVLVLVLTASGALLAVLGFALLVVHRRILRPLVQTTNALRALADSRTEAPLPLQSTHEEMAAVIGAARALQVQTRQREALERERDGLIAQLREQSNTDFLTHLPNRRAFLAAAEGVLAQAKRLGFDVVLVMLDVDNFKQLNDTLGHACGDQALIAVANAVRSALRLGDLAARFGGEEFVVLLSHCDSAQGMRLAERLRELIGATPFDCGTEAPVRVTASLGVAASDTHGPALDRLLAQADTAMYRAKQAGRNQVILAEPAEAH